MEARCCDVHNPDLQPPDLEEKQEQDTLVECVGKAEQDGGLALPLVSA